MNVNRHRRWWKKGLGIVAFVIIASAVFGWAVTGLWNWLMPPLFGLGTITFWQALGLFLLGRILFGGFRGFGRGHHRHRRMHERWEQMTPEQRESFSRGLKQGCPWGRRSTQQDDAGTTEPERR